MCWSAAKSRTATASSVSIANGTRPASSASRIPNWVSGVSTTPRYLVRDQVGAANSTPGGLILDSTGGVANRLRGTYFGQGGQVLQYQYGALTFPVPSGVAAPSLTQGGTGRSTIPAAASAWIPRTTAAVFTAA